MNLRITAIIFTLSTITTIAAGRMHTWAECLGSSRPYPTPHQRVEIPDSLTPILINHVGRHGARMPSSAKSIDRLHTVLLQAASRGCLTPLGHKMLSLTEYVRSVAVGRWGALDTLGAWEQRSIAWRMIQRTPRLFNSSHSTSLLARASHVPRCIMSMYDFCHEVAWCHTDARITALSGPQYDSLLRFFDVDTTYIDYRNDGPWRNTFDTYSRQNTPIEPLRRLVSDKMSIADIDHWQQVVTDEFSLLTSLAAMGIDFDPTPYITLDEANRLWSVKNLRQYYQYSVSSFSSLPAQAARTLLDDILATFDAAARSPLETATPIVLRFGHAETLMPLFALMKIPGAYLPDASTEQITKLWHNYSIVPMAANLQMIMLRSPTSARLYVMTLLNEHLVQMLPTQTEPFVLWSDLRSHIAD